MWDPRIIMAMVHRYGEACRAEEHARAGALYSEIVRALEHDETAPPSEEDGAATMSASSRV